MKRSRVIMEMTNGWIDVLQSGVMSAAEGAKLSALRSRHDALGKPTTALLEVCLEAIRFAQTVDLQALEARSADASRYLSVFPGEHYRLLAGLVRVTAPSHIVEIGTFTGLSALAMLATLPSGGHLTTFDVVPWDQIDDSALRSEDFADGRLEQRIGDLSQDATYDEYRATIEAADIIFIDGPKDSKFESSFLEMLFGSARTRGSLVVLDDIGFPNMLRLWDSIALPKLDVTSFGHWSGTGVVSLPRTLS